jgi:hypothetical protein
VCNEEKHEKKNESVEYSCGRSKLIVDRFLSSYVFNFTY